MQHPYKDWLLLLHACFHLMFHSKHENDVNNKRSKYKSCFRSVSTSKSLSWPLWVKMVTKNLPSKKSISYLHTIPVLRMIEHCNISCGADSRNASNNPEPSTPCWISLMILQFSGMEVSIRNRPMHNLKFLKLEKIMFM